MKTFKLVIKLVLCYIALVAAALLLYWLYSFRIRDGLGFSLFSGDSALTLFLIYERFIYFISAFIYVLLAAGYSVLIFLTVCSLKNRRITLALNAIIGFALSFFLPDLIWINIGLPLQNPFTLLAALSASCIMTLILVPIFNKLKNSKPAAQIKAVPEQDNQA